MWKKKSFDQQIESETSGEDREPDSKVYSLDRSDRLEIRDFSFQPIHAAGVSSYSEVKNKYGSLAATDQDRSEKGQRDRRFSINPLLRSPLSIQDEERRVIDEQVKRIVTEIAEREKKAASELGYEEGFKKGFDEAIQQIKGEASSKIAQFDEFLNQIDHARTDIFRVNERIIIELVYKIARMLLMKELSTDREYILRLAKELVGKVGVRENITLRINPKDAEFVGVLKGGVEKAFGNITNFNVEMNSSVKSGGCEIETEWNVINASIEAQLEEVHRSLIPEMGNQNAVDSSEGSSN